MKQALAAVFLMWAVAALAAPTTLWFAEAHASYALRGFPSSLFDEEDSFATAGTASAMVSKQVVYPLRQGASSFVESRASANLSNKSLHASSYFYIHPGPVSFGTEPGGPDTWASTRITDYLTLTSSNVKNGDLVELLFRKPRVSGELELTDPGQPEGQFWSATVGATLTVANQTVGGDRSVGWKLTSPGSYNPLGEIEVPMTMLIRAGIPLSLFLSYELETEANLVGFGGRGSLRGDVVGDANFSSSILWGGLIGARKRGQTEFLDNFTLSSLAGIDWTTPSLRVDPSIPEPGTIELAVLAVGAVMLMSRTRGRRFARADAGVCVA